MRKAIKSAALLLFSALCGQAACVQITDTLGAIGSGSPGRMNGTIILTLNQPYRVSGATTTKSRTVLNVVNGAVNTCQPGGSSLAADYSVRTPNGGEVSFTAFWVVPAAGGPYLVSDVETFTATTPSLMLAASQITSGPANTVLCSINGTVTFSVSCGGVKVYSETVTSQTLVVVPASQHNLPGGNLIVVCGGIAECGQVNLASNGTVTVTSTLPWSGTLYIVTGAATYSLPFTAATTVATPPWPQIGLNSISASACYDSSGNQFGAGTATISSSDIGIAGALPSIQYSIALGVTPQTGRCVLIGS